MLPSTKRARPDSQNGDHKRAPILEQNEWPYGSNASQSSSNMRRTMQANYQKSVDQIESPYKHVPKNKIGKNNNRDIRIIQTFKEIQPNEMHLTFDGKLKSSKHKKQIFMSQNQLDLAGQKLNKTRSGYNDTLMSATITQQQSSNFNSGRWLNENHVKTLHNS